MTKWLVNGLYNYKVMQNKWKFRLGVILCLMGAAILSSSLLVMRYLPGGLALLALGLILISDSRK